MAKFRFKVSTPEGKVKVGHVGAADEDTARKRLEGSGFTVLELESTEGGSSLEIHSNKRSVGTRIPRAQSRGYQPGLVDFIEDIESEPKRRNTLLGGIALIGFIVAILYGVNEARSRAKPDIVEPTYEKVSLAITGKAVVDAKKREKTTLVFHFPEVPLDLERPYQELVQEDGSFKLEYEFESQRAPSYLTASLRVGGKDVSATEKTLLSGEPKSAQLKTLRADR